MESEFDPRLSGDLSMSSYVIDRVAMHLVKTAFSKWPLFSSQVPRI